MIGNIDKNQYRKPNYRDDWDNLKVFDKVCTAPQLIYDLEWNEVVLSVDEFIVTNKNTYNKTTRKPINPPYAYILEYFKRE